MSFCRYHSLDHASVSKRCGFKAAGWIVRHISDPVPIPKKRKAEAPLPAAVQPAPQRQRIDERHFLFVSRKLKLLKGFMYRYEASDKDELVYNRDEIKFPVDEPSVKAMLDEEVPVNRVHPNLEVRKVPEDDPVVELRGQNGVFAKEDIKAGTALCDYFGEWLMDKEAEACRKESTCLFEIDTPSYKYVIDASDGRGNGVAEMFNDYRVHVDDLDNPANDPNRCNVGTMQVRYKGLPDIAHVAKRDIKKGEQLFTDYRPQFWLRRQARLQKPAAPVQSSRKQLARFAKRSVGVD
jgi:hypothetical protein